MGREDQEQSNGPTMGVMEYIDIARLGGVVNQGKTFDSVSAKSNRVFLLNVTRQHQLSSLYEAKELQGRNFKEGTSRKVHVISAPSVKVEPEENTISSGLGKSHRRPRYR